MSNPRRPPFIVALFGNTYWQTVGSAVIAFSFERLRELDLMAFYFSARGCATAALFGAPARPNPFVALNPSSAQHEPLRLHFPGSMSSWNIRSAVFLRPASFPSRPVLNCSICLATRSAPFLSSAPHHRLPPLQGCSVRR
jgi:hypothetical protein